MLRWLKGTIIKLLFVFNIIAGVLLLCAYSASFTPPSQLYILALIAVGYPILLLINFIFAIWWLYKRKRYFYFSAIILILGFNHFFNFFGFSFYSSEAKGESVRLMSYNVRYFNATAILGEEDLKTAQQEILNTIQEKPVDIFCGQEFTGKTKRYNKITRQFLRKEMGLNYHYEGGGSSLAIYSKYPIIKTGTIDFDGSYNGAIYADIKYGKQTIRVYSFHLQSIRLGGDEDELFNKENISSLGKGSTQKKYRRIGSKLKRAFLLREEQANFISEHITDSPYPTLVCGDMNDTPISYAYRKLSGELKDAFCERGGGFGSTYAGSLPFLRIDYTFCSSEWAIHTFEVHRKTTSDHYPIHTEISLKDEIIN